MEKKKGFLTHFLIISGGTLVNMAIGLLTTPIITRIVDPTDYGQLSIFNVYTSIALMVLCLGFDQALVRFFYHSDMEYQKRLLNFCIKIPISLCLLCFSIVVLLLSMNIVKIEFTNFILILLFLNIFLTIMNRFLSLVLRLTYDTKKFTMTNIIQKIVYVVSTLVLVTYHNNDYFNILAISTVLAVFISTLYVLVNIKKYLLHVDKGIPLDKKEIFTYSFPFIFSMGLTTLFQAIDKMSLNYFCDYEVVGIYSSAMSIINIFSIIQTSFNSLWAPMQIEHYTKNPEDKSFYERGNQFITVVMFFIGIHLILFKDLFALLLGEKFRSVVYIIPMLIFNPMMYTISETTCCGIVISKKSYLNIVVSLFACLTNFIGNMILVPLYQGSGAAISTGLAYIVFYLARTLLSNKYFYVNFHLKKFFILLIATVLFALYNTFVRFNLMTLVFYLLLMVIFVGLYKATFIEGIQYLIEYLKKFLKKGQVE